VLLCSHTKGANFIIPCSVGIDTSITSIWEVIALLRG